MQPHTYVRSTSGTDVYIFHPLDLSECQSSGRMAIMITPTRSNLTDGLSVIRILAKEGHPLGVTQISRQLNAPKSSTYRVLQTLCQIGFVEKHEPRSQYAINPVIFGFIHSLANHFGRNLKLEKHLRQAAQRHRCTVYLSMLGDYDTYIIAGAGEEGNTSRLGTHGHAYATSVGKVLVAQLNESEWAAYAPRPDSDIPSKYCNCDPEHFYGQVREARQKGFAWNHRESSEEHVSIATVVQEPFAKRIRLAVAFLFHHSQMFTLNEPEIEIAIRKLALELEDALGVTDTAASMLQFLKCS